jgi:hypothetical protein
MSLIALVIALSVAVVVLGATLVYRVRVERRRSDARVAALAATLDDPALESIWANSQERVGLTPSPGVSLTVPEEVHASRMPAFAAAALVVVSASALLVIGMNSSARPSRHVAAAGTAASSSIELVSMRHALDGETLIVSGLVRNATTTVTPALSAVVSVIGRDGQIVARGESPLDPAMLGPGKETNFRVSVPRVAEPGRYRVAFVNGSHIVPHVDRRADLSRTALANDARGN